MYFEKTGQRNEVAVRGDEILKLNRIIRKEESDITWIKYALGETIEGYVHFLDWNLFCIVGLREGYASKQLYWHIEERKQENGRWVSISPSIDLRGFEPWNKLYIRDHIIRFLVWKLMEIHNISHVSILKSRHPKREPTIPKQQQVVNTFKLAIDNICAAQGLHIKDYQEKTTENGWVSIVAAVWRPEKYITTDYYHILIGTNGRVFFINKSSALSDVRSEWKGQKAKEHLYYMKNNPKYV
jgi:hypothetical protein